MLQILVMPLIYKKDPVFNAHFKKYNNKYSCYFYNHVACFDINEAKSNKLDFRIDYKIDK